MRIKKQQNLVTNYISSEALALVHPDYDPENGPHHL